MRTHLLPALALTALLAGCGAGAGDAAGDPAAEQPVPTDGGAAAGACLEGTEDCVDADLSGGDLAPAEAGPFDLEGARRDARSLLGQVEEDVLELWGDVRVGRHGDQEHSLTFDLQPGRKTIATEDDGTGTYRVVEVVLETPDGQETFTG